MRTHAERYRLLRRGASLLGVLFVTSPAAAATLTVGTGQTYATPCAAVAAAQPNDEIDISPGTYTDTCSIGVAGVTLKGVGGQPTIDLSAGTPFGEKGIYVIDAPGVTLENLELTGSHIDAGSGENGAAIRIEAQNLTVRGCYIHDNQDGILGAPLTAGGTLLIESTELSHNGLGSGCDDGNGCTHNVYIGANVATFTFQYNWSHDLATDTPDKGHLLKSRAQQTYVLYNRISGEADTDSYEIDIPQGGLAVLVGNVVQKPATSGNSTLVSYAEEGATNSDLRVFAVNNTFVNDHGGGTFLSMSNGGMLTAHNNLFAGTGTPSSAGALSADNLSGVDPLFVDAANYDFHLRAGSPAIGAGVSPGSADTFSLTPVDEYVQPLGMTTRADDGSTLGAFAYGAPAASDAGSTAGTDSGPGQDGGVAPSGDGSTDTGRSDGGARNGDDGSAGRLDGSSGSKGRTDAAGAGSGTGASESGDAGSSGGCAVSGSRERGARGDLIALALGLVVVLSRGAKRRASSLRASRADRHARTRRVR